MISSTMEYCEWIALDTASARERLRTYDRHAITASVDAVTLLTGWGRLLRLTPGEPRDPLIAEIQALLINIGTEAVGAWIAESFDVNAWVRALDSTVEGMARQVEPEINPANELAESGAYDDDLRELFTGLDEILCAIYAAGVFGERANILLPLEDSLSRAQNAFDEVAEVFVEQVDFVTVAYGLFRSDLMQEEPGLFLASRHFRDVLRAFGRSIRLNSQIKYVDDVANIRGVHPPKINIKTGSTKVSDSDSSRNITFPWRAIGGKTAPLRQAATGPIDLRNLAFAFFRPEREVSLGNNPALKIVVGRELKIESAASWVLRVPLRSAHAIESITCHIPGVDQFSLSRDPEWPDLWKAHMPAVSMDNLWEMAIYIIISGNKFVIRD